MTFDLSHNRNRFLIKSRWHLCRSLRLRDSGEAKLTRNFAQLPADLHAANADLLLYLPSFSESHADLPGQLVTSGATRRHELPRRSRMDRTRGCPSTVPIALDSGALSAQRARQIR